VLANIVEKTNIAFRIGAINLVVTDYLLLESDARPILDVNLMLDVMMKEFAKCWPKEDNVANIRILVERDPKRYAEKIYYVIMGFAKTLDPLIQFVQTTENVRNIFGAGLIFSRESISVWKN
jgi:hypothetical protein